MICKQTNFSIILFLLDDLEEEQGQVFDRLESPLSTADLSNVLNRLESHGTAGMEVKLCEISPLIERCQF